MVAREAGMLFMQVQAASLPSPRHGRHAKMPFSACPKASCHAKIMQWWWESGGAGGGSGRRLQEVDLLTALPTTPQASRQLHGGWGKGKGKVHSPKMTLPSPSHTTTWWICQKGPGRQGGGGKCVCAGRGRRMPAFTTVF